MGSGGPVPSGAVSRAWMAVLATLVAIPACGGDDGAAEEALAPDAWVATVCGEVARAAVDLEAALAVIDELPDEATISDIAEEYAQQVKKAEDGG